MSQPTELFSRIANYHVNKLLNHLRGKDSVEYMIALMNYMNEINDTLKTTANKIILKSRKYHDVDTELLRLELNCMIKRSVNTFAERA